MSKHPHDEETVQPGEWKWTLTQTGQNEWRGTWTWSGDGTPIPPIPPDQPPHG